METFAQLESFVVVLLAGCALIAAISGACAAVVKFWRYAHRQSDETAHDMEDVKTYLASDKRRIENLEAKQDEAEAQNKLMLKALVALLGHEIDGNHVDRLAGIRNEIQEYLIER